MDLCKTLASYKQVFVVCDSKVQTFARSIGDYPLLTVCANEQNKTLQTAEEVCLFLLNNEADRNALVLAVGGGFVSDVVGFAASIYKRGIDYANIPTTLLAMVDAGIGGKTGVNLGSYKNMIGSFHLPKFSFCNIDALLTLPKRDFLSGAAEMLKTFIICNKKDSYARAVKLFSSYAKSGNSALNAPETRVELQELIKNARAVKEKICRKDFFEHGERRKLNLGHTWAHAIEWWKPGVYTHGEAVAIGLVLSARKAEELGLAAKGLADRIKADLASCGLPSELPCSQSELLPAMKRDKKAYNGAVLFALPVRIGKVVIKLINF